MPVDGVDAQILRELAWNPANPVDVERGIQGAWDIARGLRVHGNTVKRRLQELESSGVLLGLRMIPDAHVVNLQVGYYGLRFDTQEGAIDAERKIVARRLPGITCRLDGHEVRYNLAVPASHDLAAAASDDAERLGARSHELITVRHHVEYDSSELERRIMNVYMRDALVPAAEVADIVGVTPRTVRNRMAHLVTRRVLNFVPFVDFLAVNGAVSMLFDIDTGIDVAAAHRALRAEPRLVLNGPPAMPMTNAYAIVDSLGDAMAMADRIARLPGVIRVTPRFVLSNYWSGLPESGITVTEGITAMMAEADGPLQGGIEDTA